MYTHTRNRRQRRLNADVRARILDAVLGILATVIMAAMFAWVGLNWVTGCGERFPTADGGYIEGECVLMPWRD